MAAMKSKPLDWDLIDVAAEALGVSVAARKKWRQRGVPYRWRFPIIKQTGGAIPMDAFETLAPGAEQGDVR